MLSGSAGSGKLGQQPTFGIQLPDHAISALGISLGDEGVQGEQILVCFVRVFDHPRHQLD